jgi:hypothetical protein
MLWGRDGGCSASVFEAAIFWGVMLHSFIACVHGLYYIQLYTYYGETPIQDLDLNSKLRQMEEI